MAPVSTFTVADFTDAYGIAEPLADHGVLDQGADPLSF